MFQIVQSICGNKQIINCNLQQIELHLAMLSSIIQQIFGWHIFNKMIKWLPLTSHLYYYKFTEKFSYHIDIWTKLFEILFRVGAIWGNWSISSFSPSLMSLLFSSSIFNSDPESSNLRSLYCLFLQINSWYKFLEYK